MSLSLKKSHSTCPMNLSHKMSLSKCLTQNVFLKMSHSNYLTQNMLIKMSLSQNVSFKMSHLKSLTVNIPWISHSKCLNPNVSLGSNLTCRLNSYKAGKSCVTAQTHSSATLIQSLIVRLANLG